MTLGPRVFDPRALRTGAEYVYWLRNTTFAPLRSPGPGAFLFGGFARDGACLLCGITHAVDPAHSAAHPRPSYAYEIMPSDLERYYFHEVLE